MIPFIVISRKGKTIEIERLVWLAGGTNRLSTNRNWKTLRDDGYILKLHCGKDSLIVYTMKFIKLYM